LPPQRPFFEKLPGVNNQRVPMADANGMVRWGGVRLDKANAKLQEQLGLAEKEGLVVVGFDANSIGEKAGLKKDDVLVKLNDKVVPNDATSFTLLVKDQKADQPFDLVVVRNGKEVALKGASMPLLVQNMAAGRGQGLAGMQGIPGLLNPGMMQINPFMQQLHAAPLEPGTKIVRTQEGEKFSGELSKDALKITVAGKMDLGQPKVTSITIVQGKESKTYTDLGDVPAKHISAIRQLLPSGNNAALIPGFPNIEFPGFAFP